MSEIQIQGQSQTPLSKTYILFVNYFHVHVFGNLVKKWHNLSYIISWAGRRGYRAPPGNQFLIDVSRLEKYNRKRLTKKT